MIVMIVSSMKTKKEKDNEEIHETDAKDIA